MTVVAYTQRTNSGYEEDWSKEIHFADYDEEGTVAVDSSTTDRWYRENELMDNDSDGMGEGTYA